MISRILSGFGNKMLHCSATRILPGTLRSNSCCVRIVMRLSNVSANISENGKKSSSPWVDRCTRSLFPDRRAFWRTRDSSRCQQGGGLWYLGGIEMKRIRVVASAAAIGFSQRGRAAVPMAQDRWCSTIPRATTTPTPATPAPATPAPVAPPAATTATPTAPAATPTTPPAAVTTPTPPAARHRLRLRRQPPTPPPPASDHSASWHATRRAGQQLPEVKIIQEQPKPEPKPAPVEEAAPTPKKKPSPVAEVAPEPHPLRWSKKKAAAKAQTAPKASAAVRPLSRNHNPQPVDAQPDRRQRSTTTYRRPCQNVAHRRQ